MLRENFAVSLGNSDSSNENSSGGNCSNGSDSDNEDTESFMSNFVPL
jgi:hypothetical protein